MFDLSSKLAIIKKSVKSFIRKKDKLKKVYKHLNFHLSITNSLFLRVSFTPTLPPPYT